MKRTCCPKFSGFFYGFPISTFCLHSYSTYTYLLVCYAFYSSWKNDEISDTGYVRVLYDCIVFGLLTARIGDFVVR